MFKIGIDVGGTFTDFLVTDGSGTAKAYKTPSVPQQPAEAVFAGLTKIAGDRDESLRDFLAQVDVIVHGTTITTNAALTGKGAKTGLLTTRGFRDLLNMRRGVKESPYRRYNPPPQLVPRYMIESITERSNAEGQIVVPLAEDEVRAAARRFRELGVEAVAVCYLWSFFNPANEQRTAAIISEELPGVYVSLSSEMLPQIRVYERISTTTLNSYVGPLLSRYLSELTRRLGEHGFEGVLLIMQSNGGVMSPEMSARFAVNTLLSGPAGAPTAGGFYSGIHGIRDFITVDMGGTSFDACLVKNCEPAVTTEGTIGGYRVALPILDIHTIGAGGGSIAYVDAGGLLHVGPESAGADPGPVCYARGGSVPTVTDADLVLGYLDSDSFFGGEIKLDRQAAERAIREHVARPLKLDLITAAQGIYRVINANMAAALRVVSVQKGYDPREFALVVAGGAGPLHAVQIARELEIPSIIVPRESSVFCAAGMLLSDLKHDYVRTFTCDVTKVRPAEINVMFEEIEKAARATLECEGMADGRIIIQRSVDLRYIGQHNEVEVSLPEPHITAVSLGALAASFHARHDLLYGYSMTRAALELMNLRVRAVGLTDKPHFESLQATGHDMRNALKGYREAYFDNELLKTPVYDGLKLENGDKLVGPAIVEQPNTTLVLPTGYRLVCDAYSNYILSSLPT